MQSRKLDLFGVAMFLLICVACVGVRHACSPKPLEQLRASADGDGDVTVYEGSWLLPRQGPNRVGFESPNGVATLWIDGRQVVRGQGVVATRREPWPAPRSEERELRRPYAAGAVALKFRAPRGARLLWKPAGRRGPDEYVPASVLSGDSPERAQFGDGARVFDGVCITIMLLAFLGLIAFLARGSLRNANRWVLVSVAACFAFALLVRLIGLNEAGQTWDEDVNWSAGRNYVTNLLSLDFSESSWRWNFQHPPVMKYIAGIGAQWSNGFGPARVLSATMVAMGCALLVPIGARLYRLHVGVVAAVFAALTPHLIAHSKVVGHEAPTVLWWALSLWLCLRAHDPFHRSNTLHPAREVKVRFALIGVVLGVALMSRFVNGLLAPLIAITLISWSPPRYRLWTVKWGLAIIPIVAVFTSVLLWPRLWTTPFVHLQESYAILSKLHSVEPFLGSMTNSPPRYYFAVYLIATAPIVVLLGAAAWLGRICLQRNAAALVGLAWLAIPLAVMFSPVRQDGVRYILPSVLALSFVAAAGLEFAVLAVSRRLSGSAARFVVLVLAGGVAVYLYVINHRIHPYYLDYYGEHYGGTSGVAEAKAFEVAWWGEGLEDAIGYVNRHAAKDARVFKGCVEPSHLAWLRSDLWPREARRADQAEWILAYAPLSRPCTIPPDARLVHEVQADGAPLARVYRRD